jgi:hypothetical protein
LSAEEVFEQSLGFKENNAMESLGARGIGGGDQIGTGSLLGGKLDEWKKGSGVSSGKSQAARKGSAPSE